MYGEDKCPDFCILVESCVCCGFAVSASRMYVMDKYELKSDPCDYRIIRITNTLQLMSCCCECVSALCCGEDSMVCADILDIAADIAYFCVSGCMTAQVSLSSSTNYYV
jgi:hypothetical protein